MSEIKQKAIIYWWYYIGDFCDACLCAPLKSRHIFPVIVVATMKKKRKCFSSLLVGCRRRKPLTLHSKRIIEYIFTSSKSFFSLHFACCAQVCMWFAFDPEKNVYIFLSSVYLLAASYFFFAVVFSIQAEHFASNFKMRRSTFPVNPHRTNKQRVIFLVFSTVLCSRQWQQ